MTEIDDIDGLKLVTGTAGQIYYVKRFSSYNYITSPPAPYPMGLSQGGGVFEWRTDLSSEYQISNNGTIVKPTGYSGSGRWVRKYDGYLNIAWFGASGAGGNDTAAFQAAIDFAALNAVQQNAYWGGPQLKTSTIYIPNGSYFIDTLTLKDGISIVGESVEYTKLFANNTNPAQSLFVMQNGRVRLNISNLHINGRHSTKGCFNFKAVAVGVDGGLWTSTFKNIYIGDFKGDAIVLEGQGDYFGPNQWNIFENVAVNKDIASTGSDSSVALRLKGQNAQTTFLNCRFDGIKNSQTSPPSYSKNWNVSIENINYPTSDVITFLNCTFQQSDYGIKIYYAESITIDNCWFEDLGIAISVESNPSQVISKGINVVNSRFANASGFGSLPTSTSVVGGACIRSIDSVVNIHNNVVTVSDVDNVAANKMFVTGNSGNYGLNLTGNTFQSNKLARCSGVMQTLNVTLDGSEYKLLCNSNRIVAVNASVNPIRAIVANVNPGEMISVRANGNITFTTLSGTTGNLFLSNKSTVALAAGDIAQFIKLDIGNDDVTYQLVSVMRSATAI